MGRFMDTELFVKKAKGIHGDTIDYSNVDYKNSLTKVELICKKCGRTFHQNPNNHLSGQGCPYCNGKPKSNTEDFIKRAKRVHGDKYDYSNVDYQNAKTLVEIRCKDCGNVFLQRPNNHLNGQGCNKCCGVDTHRLTTEKFIEKARLIHGEKYDYSGTEYVNTRTKVVIKCPKHGYFLQVANHHLNGNGCPICSRRVKMDVKEFVDNAVKVHGNNYDYSQVVYNGNSKPVTIKCNTCGNTFQQTPSSHLKGHKCQRCRNNEAYALNYFAKLAKSVKK